MLKEYIGTGLLLNILFSHGNIGTYPYLILVLLYSRSTVLLLINCCCSVFCFFCFLIFWLFYLFSSSCVFQFLLITKLAFVLAAFSCFFASSAAFFFLLFFFLLSFLIYSFIFVFFFLSINYTSWDLCLAAAAAFSSVVWLLLLAPSVCLVAAAAAFCSFVECLFFYLSSAAVLRSFVIDASSPKTVFPI